jgi:prepilin-type N-terminal cleavage/methylation domain-containing protein
MKRITHSHANFFKGFTLIEMLVSILIFSAIMIAVFYFFDRGQWLYLQSDRKSNIQANARLTMEALERDLRMIGYGVPTGGKSGATATRWTPVIFLAGQNQISFRADIDNGSAYLTQNATGTRFNVDPVSDVLKYQAGTNVILVTRRRTWFDSVSTAINTGTGEVTISNTLPAAFPSSSSKAYTMEEVYWRFVAGSKTVQRQENQVRLPTGTAAGTWETVATEVELLQFEYFSGTTPLTSLPLSAGNSNNVNRIVITLVGKDRTDKAGEYQTTTLKSEIRVRNRGRIGG